ncbi:MAG: HAD-IB family phosphatase [Desulfurococcaceae archaeon]
MWRKLVVFDCDGVLTESRSSWEVLHEYFGSGDNKYFAELYKRGMITYLDWMKIDIALMINSWKKPILKEDVVRALSSIKLKSSSIKVVNELRKRGVLLAVVSSGVDILVKRVCEHLGIDLCFYNDLMFVDNELLPGGVDRVPLKEKPKIIERLAVESGVDLINTVYVGDSEWDIEVFKIVGVPVAVEPCGKACQYAKYVIRDLEELLNIPELQE